jgi:hypothetical protein
VGETASGKQKFKVSVHGKVRRKEIGDIKEETQNETDRERERERE